MTSKDFEVEIDGMAFNCMTDLNVEYNKLWGEDAGRTYDTGEFMGTLIGNFPKLEIEFAPKDAVELSNLIARCKRGNVTLKWYNPEFMLKVTSQFQTNNFSVSLKNALSGDYDRFKVTFTSKNRDAS